MKSKFIFQLIAFFVFGALKAQLKIAPILSNNMVLQRNTEVQIWGTATPGEKISVKASWSKETFKVVSKTNGEWLVKVKTIEAGGPYNLKVTSSKESIVIQNILLGEVWLCSGQSNMEMPVLGYNNQPVNGSLDALFDADDDNIRLFKLKANASETPQMLCSGIWSVSNAESVGKFSAVGYFYAKLLQKKLHVPIGIIFSAWGGTRIEAWMSKETILKYPEPFALSTAKKVDTQNQAAHLYNGMIAPITNYTIKGVIWYQGEGNVENPNEYAALMSGLVENWRSNFGVGQFPFYFVQIAAHPYGWINQKLPPILRDQQTKASLSIQNVGMVSAIDIGEEKSIHPAEKLTVSKRLANWALSETYGLKGIPYKSPVFKNLEVKDSIALIALDNAELGLSTFGKEVECFEIAGRDSIFYPAMMKILKNKVQVWSKQVKEPTAVRYAYSCFPKTKGFLYSTAGLPVLPFNSFNWLE
ncbi:MAG: sialate O-acetylesterase [Chitinophagaceae bacterium BSSC1]|nr:MAG: sialate O-acetylesterase [Chitinophagaceae bacterium BSSC1]